MAKATKKALFKDRTKPVITYLHPDANLALDQIAARKSTAKTHVKKHDLSIEGYRHVLRKNGYAGPVSADDEARAS